MALQNIDYAANQNNMINSMINVWHYQSILPLVCQHSITFLMNEHVEEFIRNSHRL